MFYRCTQTIPSPHFCDAHQQTQQREAYWRQSRNHEQSVTAKGASRGLFGCHDRPLCTADTQH